MPAKRTVNVFRINALCRPRNSTRPFEVKTFTMQWPEASLPMTLFTRTFGDTWTIERVTSVRREE